MNGEAALQALERRDVTATTYQRITHCLPVNVRRAEAAIRGMNDRLHFRTILVLGAELHDAPSTLIVPPGNVCVAYCLDLDRFLTSLSPPRPAPAAASRLRAILPPRVRLGWRWPRGVSLDQVARHDAAISVDSRRVSRAEERTRRLLGSGPTTAQNPVILLGWPIYGSTNGAGLIDAVSGSFVLDSG